MNRNDWMGLGTSLGLHALLLLVLAFIAAASPEPEPLGFVEVELGTFSQGRPVQRAAQDQPRREAERPQPKREEARARAAPQVSKPVRLPKPPQDVPDPDKVNTPKTEEISPEAPSQDVQAQRNEPREEVRPTQPQGGGAREGTSGASDGAQGAGTDETKAAPFLIEGLNRDAVFTPAPPFREKVNAVIRFRIVVDPRGHIVSAVPVLKANPALESAARDVLLQRWRFNPLPANAPQVNQTGAVTFRFRLE